MENKEGETRGFPILLASCLGPSVLQVPRLFLLLVCLFLSFSGRQLCGFLTLSRLDFFFPLAESEVRSCLPLLSRTVRGIRSAAGSGARVPLGLGTGEGIQSAKSHLVEAAYRLGKPWCDLPMHLVGVEKRWGICRGAGMLGMRD